MPVNEPSKERSNTWFGEPRNKLTGFEVKPRIHTISDSQQDDVKNAFAKVVESIGIFRKMLFILEHFKKAF